MPSRNPQVSIQFLTEDGVVLEGTCLASAVPVWTSKGWEVVEDDQPVVEQVQPVLDWNTPDDTVDEADEDVADE